MTRDTRMFDSTVWGAAGVGRGWPCRRIGRLDINDVTRMGSVAVWEGVRVPAFVLDQDRYRAVCYLPTWATTRVRQSSGRCQNRGRSCRGRGKVKFGETVAC